MLSCKMTYKDGRLAPPHVIISCKKAYFIWNPLFLYWMAVS